MRTRRRSFRTRFVVSMAASLAMSATACVEDHPTNIVTGGTINGVPFTVISGTVRQGAPNSVIYSDSAVILLDGDPVSLGMSDANRIHVYTEFALELGGAITLGAFGTAQNPLGHGNAVVIGRADPDFDYAFYIDNDVFVDSSFYPQPSEPAFVQSVITEFYKQDVPGYGAGSGIAMWPLNDRTPSLGEDVLGCVAGPAMQTGTLSGDRVAIAFGAAFIVSLEVADTIIGPCVTP